jgi:hypothetical protein
VRLTANATGGRARSKCSSAARATIEDDLELKEQIAEALLRQEEYDRAAERLLKLAELHKNLGDRRTRPGPVRRLLQSLPEHRRCPGTAR